LFFLGVANSVENLQSSSKPYSEKKYWSTLVPSQEKIYFTQDHKTCCAKTIDLEQGVDRVRLHRFLVKGISLEGSR
jgi:hypothetical protein